MPREARVSQVADGSSSPQYSQGLFLVSTQFPTPTLILRRKEAGETVLFGFLKATGPGHTTYIQNLVGLGQVDSAWYRWQAPHADLAKFKSQLHQFPLLCHWAQGQNKVHQAGGLESRTVCSPSTRGWQSKIKVSAWTVSPEASLFGM